MATEFLDRDRPPFSLKFVIEQAPEFTQLGKRGDANKATKRRLPRPKMKVLIAIDGSKASEVVLKRVSESEWPVDTTFCAITVLDPFFFSHEMELIHEARNSARRFLKEVTQDFEAKGYEVICEVILGNPRQAISECAETWRADLLLVGSQGLNELERLALGSTVRAILRRAKCSVEVVRGRRKEDENINGVQRILIATDGSEISQAALGMIANRPWPEGTEMKVVSVPQCATVLGTIPIVFGERMNELRREEIETARQAAEEGKEILLKRGFKVVTEVTRVSDSPAGKILEVAERWDADLLVVGSHGRRGFDRFALGSVSDCVAMNAPCSVEVVRLPQHRELEGEIGGPQESAGSPDFGALCVL